MGREHEDVLVGRRVKLEETREESRAGIWKEIPCVSNLLHLGSLAHVAEDVALIRFVVDQQWHIVELSKVECPAWQVGHESAVDNRPIVEYTIAELWSRVGCVDDLLAQHGKVRAFQAAQTRDGRAVRKLEGLEELAVLLTLVEQRLPPRVLGNGSGERRSINSSVGGELESDRPAACRTAPDGHSARIATEAADVTLYPFESIPLIKQSGVQHTILLDLAAAEEAEDAESVLDRDVDDTL